MLILLHVKLNGLMIIYTFLDDKTDPSRYSIDLETTVGKVTLKIKLVEDYPMVVPEMEITSSSHKLVVHDLLKALMQEVI